LFYLFTPQLFAQATDSSKVEKVTYGENDFKKEIVLVSAQQLKAKEFYEKGYSFVENHEFEKAIKALKKAVNIDSTGNCGTGTNGIAYSELGNAYLRIGDFKNAIVYLEKAINLNKLSPEAYQSKAVLLMQQGKNDLALTVLDSLIKFVSSYAIAYVQRGFLYNKMNKYESALQDLTQFLQLIKIQNQELGTSSLIENVKKQIAEIKSKIEK
jgi:tetratricopeptide (TPR) repeat protein